MNIEELVERLVQEKIREYLSDPDCKSVKIGSIPIPASISPDIRDLAECFSIQKQELSTDNSLKTRVALDEYAQDHLRGLGTGAERERQLRRVLGPHLNQSLPSISQRDLSQALGRWTGATRNRYRSALTHFYRWARAHGHVDLNPTFMGAREVSRDEVMSLDQVRRLLKTAERRGPWGAFGKLLILTAQRRGDVMNMRPRDIHGDQWVQPTSKNGTSHVVFLTPRVQDVLLNEWQGDGFTWTGKTTFSDFKRRWFTDAGVPLTFRLHDLRRAFATQMVEAGHSPDVVDRHLNHMAAATARGVARVYNVATLLPQRRELMVAWDRLLFP